MIDFEKVLCHKNEISYFWSPSALIAAFSRAFLGLKTLSATNLSKRQVIGGSRITFMQILVQFPKSFRISTKSSSKLFKLDE